MADKVFLPETIADNPFPIAGDLVIAAGATTDTVLTPGSDTQLKPAESVSERFPERYIAHATISETIDTQSKKILGAYEFGVLGSLQIGAYENGVSGDLKISPNGIVARNVNGVTTFSIDGTTGDATFLGTVAAGSIITGYVAVGGSAADVNSGIVLISGGKVEANYFIARADVGQTLSGSVNVGSSKVLIDGVNTRIIINDGTNDRILIGYQSGGF